MLLSWSSGRLGRGFAGNRAGTAMFAETIDKEEQVGAVDEVVNGQSYAQFSVVEYYYGDGQAALAAAKKALELLPLSYTFSREPKHQ